MEYQVASSSTEESVSHPEDSSPFRKSHLRFSYYPGTTRFIGQNTVPRIEDLRSHSVTVKMKKELKAMYPYVQFSLLEGSREFFGSKFTFISALEPPRESEPKGEFLAPVYTGDHTELKLVALTESIPEVTKERKPTSNPQPTPYERLSQQLFLQKEKQSSAVQKVLKSQATRIILLEDRMLDAMEKKNAFIFLRVVSQLVSQEDSSTKTEKKVKKYIFEDVFYSSAKFYEFLEIFAADWVRSFRGSEFRVYTQGTTAVMLHSSTTVRVGGQIKRLFSGIDTVKNAFVLCNRNGPTFTEINGKVSENIQYLINLDLPEGDYVLNDMKVYRVDDSGETVEWDDIDYTDFLLKSA